jgi:intein/homing endonuclease
MVISTDEKRHLERLVDAVVEARAVFDLASIELSKRLDISIELASEAIDEADEVQDLLDKFGIEVSSCVRTTWENVQRSCTGEELELPGSHHEDDEELFGPWGDTYEGW